MVFIFFPWGDLRTFALKKKKKIDTKTKWEHQITPSAVVNHQRAFSLLNQNQNEWGRTLGC